jgi:hypothetical protein
MGMTTKMQAKIKYLDVNEKALIEEIEASADTLRTNSR